MQSEVQFMPDVTVVTLHGDLDIATVDALREVLDRAMSASPSSCIDVVLSDVSFVDVVSLSVILAAADAAREVGGQLTVTGASNSVRRLCALLNANDVLAAPVPQPRVSSG
jgi:anti-anti-sigma factor